MTHARRLAVTLSLVSLAILLVAWRYADYISNPWTRDGQVAADLVLVTPRVSGPIIELAVTDNQLVSAGDLLFRIDPRTYEAAFAQAEAAYRQAEDEIVVLNLSGRGDKDVQQIAALYE